MILASFLMNGFLMKTNFKTVSLQGIQLTRRQKEFERSRSNILRNMQKRDLVSTALNNLQKHKEQGAKAHQPWTLDFVKTGTPYLGDTFIFN